MPYLHSEGGAAPRRPPSRHVRRLLQPRVQLPVVVNVASACVHRRSIGHEGCNLEPTDTEGGARRWKTSACTAHQDTPCGCCRCECCLACARVHCERKTTCAHWVCNRFLYRWYIRGTAPGWSTRRCVQTAWAGTERHTSPPGVQQVLVLDGQVVHQQGQHGGGGRAGGGRAGGGAERGDGGAHAVGGAERVYCLPANPLMPNSSYDRYCIWLLCGCADSAVAWGWLRV